jgi:hypothetical protein
MKASLPIILAASVTFFSAGMLHAQTPAPIAAEAPKSEAAGSDKPAKKPKAAEASNSTPANKPLKPGHYATEAEANSHCRGSVVWIGSEGFTHYRGSREYGRKPGSYTCEK